jgi:hypothetical protein
MVTRYSAVGASGNQYPLFFNLIGQEIPEDKEGIFLFCRNFKENWEVIYVGSGKVKYETEKILKEGKVIEKGATHIYFHVDNDNESRFRKEADIIAGNQECYEPTGCNIRM